MVLQAKSQGIIFLLNWVPGGGEEKRYAEDLDGVGGVGPAADEQVEVVEPPEPGALDRILVVAVESGVAVVLIIL